ncbi:MAG: VWA domain-containing protein [Planctomycetes bacterium]|nr:VWA domain-containing protein [Planctomycetota bacterium]
MINPRSRCALACLLAFLGPAVSVFGQTIIIDPWIPPLPVPPDPRPVPPRRIVPPLRDVRLQVRQHHVEVSIVDNVAVTNVDQVFFNPHQRTVEGTYIFPLGDDVALNRFSMFVNGREIKGELLDVEEARRTYESIVARMRDPALLEYIGSKMFRARIFPINPKSEVRVKLSYTSMLASDDGLMRYQHPLNVEKNLSAPVGSVSILVSVRSAVAIKSVFSPTHKIGVIRKSDYEATASFEARNVYPDKDFELLMAMSDKEFGLTVLTNREDGQDGYFLARIAPPAGVDAGQVLPKDIAFVIDTSGSMAGEKMTQAKEAIKFCLANLNESDRFAVVPFSHEATRFEEGLTAAGADNIARARSFVEGLRAEGGTNIHDALVAAMDAAPLGDDGRPYLIVFVTDGLPTIGLTDVDEILQSVKRKNARRVRLFAFGVGNDVNTRLLDLLAEQNRGTRDYVAPDEDLELKLSSFYRKVANPVLADLHLIFGDLRVTDMFPPTLGDLFSGSELVVVGRYSGAGAKAVELTGKRRGTQERFVYETSFPNVNSNNDFLPRLWATRKVGYLLDEMRLHGENKELKDTVVALAIKYGIVTPYTAYLVTEPGPVAQRRPQPPPRFWPNANVSGNGSGRAAKKTRRPSSRGARMKSRRVPVPTGVTVPVFQDSGSVGAAAVAGSMEVKDLRGALAADEFLGERFDRPAGQTVKRVGKRTFYLVDHRWLDSDYEESMKTTKVELFSKAYFDLLRVHKGLGKCFALGKRVVVVVDGQAFETVDAIEAD